MKTIRLLAVALLAALPLLAQPIRVGPPSRVAPFRLGAADGFETLLAIAPNGNGETVYWSVNGVTASGAEFWRVDAVNFTADGSPIDGTYRVVFPARAGVDTGARVGVTGSGPILVSGTTTYSIGPDGTFSIPNAMGNVGITKAMVCGTTACVLTFYPEFAATTTRAVVLDTTGHPTAHVDLPRYAYRTGAADATGFALVGEDGGGTPHVVRLAVSGAIAWDITLPTFPPLGPDPIIGFDGNHYIVVWADPDAGTTSSTTLSTDGFLVVPPTKQNYYSGQPVALIWNGTRFLLLSEQVLKGTAGTGPYKATARIMRLGPAMNPLDLAPIDLGTGWTNGSPAAVWNGSRFFVVHGSGLLAGSGGQLFGTTIPQASAPALPQLVAYGALAQRNPQVARTTAHSIVVWPEYDPVADATTIRLSRILPGNNVSFTKELVTGPVALLATAAGGSDILTLWEHCESATSCDLPSIEGLIVRGDGSTKNITVTGVGLQNGVALAGNANGWLLAGTQPGGTLLSSVNIARDGSVSPIHLYPHGGTQLSMASDGTGFALVSTVAHCSTGTCQNTTSLTMVASDGVLVSDQSVATTGAFGIAFNGDSYGVLLEFATALDPGRFANVELVLDRFDRNGKEIGVAPGLASQFTFGGARLFTTIGRMWVVEWTDSTSITRLLSGDGMLIQDLQLSFDAVASSPDALATGISVRDDTFPPNAGAPALFSFEIDGRIPPRRRAVR